MKGPSIRKPIVDILMGTYNGAEFLNAQLESLCDQSYQSWKLTVSDDGSVDGTKDIVTKFANRVDQTVTLKQGPLQGFSKNFITLVRDLPDECEAVMFADQDDIWLPEKISKAVAALETTSSNRPLLYGSASLIWNAATDRKKMSQRQRREPGFLNALVENFATGNTMLLNAAAVRELRDASRVISNVYAHDWWAYALITGVGGQVIYDSTSTLLYRQHQGNEIGAGETFLKRQLRNLSVADGRYRKKVGQTVNALTLVQSKLTEENRQLLQKFSRARDARTPVDRLLRMMRTGVYRQSLRDTAGFWGAVALGKV